MGYTHFWERKRELTEAEQIHLMSAIRSIVETTDVPLAGPMGVGEVEWNDGSVVLNGLDDDSHETFSFPGGRWFCKTAYKPYDEVVTAILIASYAICPGAFGYGSDGRGDDWLEGLELAERALGSKYKLRIPPFDE